MTNILLYTVCVALERWHRKLITPEKSILK